MLTPPSAARARLRFAVLQIRLRDFIAWFGVPLPDDRVKPPRSRPVGRVTFIDDTGGDSAIDLRGRQQGGQHENMKQIYVEVRGRGDVDDRLGEEETGDGGNGDGDSSSSASSNIKRSSSLSNKTTAATDDGKGKKGGRWGAKVAAFGSWLGRKEKAKGGVGSSHQTKRKWTTSGLKEKQELQRDGDTDTNIVSHSHTTAADQKRATKRRRRDDDEPSAKHLLASSAAASRSPTASGNGGSVFSLNVSSRLRGRRPPEDPLKKYGKMLSVVAEQEARTLLLRRARLRAQASNVPLERGCLAAESAVLTFDLVRSTRIAEWRIGRHRPLLSCCQNVCNRRRSTQKI